MKHLLAPRYDARPSHAAHIAAWTLVVWSIGCGNQPIGNPSDAGIEVIADGRNDATIDGSADAMADARTDATTDLATDTRTDAGTDVAAGADAGADGSASSGQPMCSTDGWCWVNSAPQGNTLNGVFALSPNEVWAVGADGTTLHGINGVFTWELSGTDATLNGVWGATSNDVWAVGEGVIGHWNGTAWSMQPSPAGKWLEAIWGLAANDIWAVAVNDHTVNTDTTGNILHWDGCSWSAQGPAGYQLYSVWATGTNDVWAVGSTTPNASTGQSQPAALHWNGATWMLVANGAAIPADWTKFSGVWNAAPNDVWVRGDGTVQNGLVHYDGAAWTYEHDLNGFAMAYGGTSGEPLAIEGIWGSGPSDIFVGSTDGLHWNGTSWDTGSIAPLAAQAIHGTGPNDVWMVSNSRDTPGFVQGTLLHFDGTAWTRFGAPPPAMGDMNITAMMGTSSDDVFTLAGIQGDDNPTIWHWSASVWTNTPVDLGSVPTVAWAYSPTNAWAYGGADVHWDGTSWTEMAGGVSGTPNGVWALSQSDVWVVFQNYAKHSDGTAWQSWTAASNCAPNCLPAEVNGYFALSGVWSSGPTDVWIGGEDGNFAGSLLHWDGTTWTVQAPGTGAITSVWGSGPDDVWAVGGYPFGGGTNQTVLHWDGSTWTSMPLPVTASWVRLWGFATDDVWLAGNTPQRAGVVAHWTGTSWQVSPTGFPMLVGVWGPSSNDIWLFGARGSILRHAG